ncbi:MAG: SsrA-binding protein SmpB [Crocinitomicaceae bacterium]|nr:SsrA-binding protein SmpB [Crocinitomicaceae bacterium]
MAIKELNIKNKKARFSYFLEDEFDAGIVLSGSEIKSIRTGKASIVEAFCVLIDNEIWIRNMYVAPYENASFNKHKPKADRKLLLHKKEISKIEKHLKIKGYSVIPVKLFLNKSNWLKVKIALAKGKKLHDKRDSLKARDDKREIDRAMKRQ